MLIVIRSFAKIALRTSERRLSKFSSDKFLLFLNYHSKVSHEKMFHVNLPKKSFFFFFQNVKSSEVQNFFECFMLGTLNIHPIIFDKWSLIVNRHLNFETNTLAIFISVNLVIANLMLSVHYSCCIPQIRSLIVVYISYYHVFQTLLSLLSLFIRLKSPFQRWNNFSFHRRF